MAAHFPHFRSKRCKQTFNVELSYSSVKTCSKSQKAKLLHLNSVYVITSFPFSSKYKVEKILKGSPSPSVKIQIIGEKVSNIFLFSKVCWQNPSMFCLYTSSKLSHPKFEFSRKVKLMGLNPGYLLRYFLLYIYC